MRDLPSSKLVLNLQNFESSTAVDCQYILTSPRSLKACKQARIKPIELLHRSLSDIIEDVNLPLEVAHNIYVQHERDRQVKIELCQSIRNKFIAEGKNNSDVIPKPQLERILSSRKEKLDKENFLRAARTSSATGNTPLPKENIYKRQYGSNISKVESPSPSPESLYSVKDSAVSLEFISKTLPYNSNFQRSTETCSSLSSSSLSSLSSPRQCSSTLPLRKYEANQISRLQNSYNGKNGKKKKSKLFTSCCKDVTNDDIDKLLPKSCNKYQQRITNYFNGKVLNTKVANKPDCSLKKYDESTKLNKENKLFTENKITTGRRSKHLKRMQINKPETNKTACGNKVVGKKKSNYSTNKKKSKDDIVLDTAEKYVYCKFSQKTPEGRGSLQNLTTSRLNTNRQLHSSTSSLGIGFQPKKREKPYRFLNVDKLKIPESDRRILETLAFKKEQEKECEEIAHRAHLSWELDQQKRREFEYQKKKKWQQLIEAKRKLESEENMLRMEEIKESLRHSQKTLEKNIQKRNERSEQLKNEAEERRLVELLDKKALECKRRAIVDANLKQMEIDAKLHQQRLQDELQERLERAEYVREKEKEIIHKRVASINRTEEIRHHENVCDVNEKRDLIQEQQRRELDLKEEKARQNYIGYLKHKEKHIQQNRIDREIRLDMAKEMQRELDKGLEAWQDKVLLLQCSAVERATVAANMNVENKRLQVECENLQRQLEHSDRLRRVKELENMKKEITQNVIKTKEERMQHLQKQREKLLQEGRTQALITADLREDLRRTLSPETFNRKVARAEIELRLGSRPVTASPTMMMSSHIHLG